MQGFPRIGKEAPTFHLPALREGDSSIAFPSAGPWVLAFAESWSRRHDLEEESATFAELHTPSVLAALEELGISLLVLADAEACHFGHRTRQLHRACRADLRSVSQAYAVDCSPPTGACFVVDASGILRFAHYMSLGRTPSPGVLGDALLDAWREFSSNPGSGAARAERRIACLTSGLMDRLIANPTLPESRAIGSLSAVAPLS